ncbi:MAG: T9SS type A sorting domain-containing protein, partial [Bacteroidetes bacterium]|nr:T9SS type A sorting domain-containing protein [Bacteroidota bacterium]
SGVYFVVTECAEEILVLTINPTSSNTTTESACGSYTWALNGETYTESGVYFVVTECAEEILDLTINPVPTAPEVVNNGNELVATADPNYLGVWVDCISQQPVGNPPMPAQYTPTTTGLYTYVSLDPTTFCFTPGNCVEFEVGIDEIALHMNIYPNPTNANFVIETSVPGNVEITDLNGKLLKSFQTEIGKISVSIDGLTNGTYIVNFKSIQTTETVRLVVSGY